MNPHGAGYVGKLPFEVGLDIAKAVFQVHGIDVEGKVVIRRSLDKDAPFQRAIQRLGAISSQPVLGGLHHQYCRI